jgi:DNA-binding transcriptional ArsR family regulator
MPETQSPPAKVFSQKDVLIKHEFLEFFFGELVDMRPIFENDFDSMLVYTAISRYYLRNERVGLADAAAPSLASGATASRIAEWTRIPRETVRRKLLRLESRGLLERGPRDEWRVAQRDGQPVIRTEYAEEWRQELKRIVRFVASLKDHIQQS